MLSICYLYFSIGVEPQCLVYKVNRFLHRFYRLAFIIGLISVNSLSDRLLLFLIDLGRVIDDRKIKLVGF